MESVRWNHTEINIIIYAIPGIFICRGQRKQEELS